MIGKRYLPKSLFGRALLILVVPTLLIQLVVAYVFFDRHWDNVSRHMSGSLAGEAAFLVAQLERMPVKNKSHTITDFEASTDIKVSIEPVENFHKAHATEDLMYFQESLGRKIKQPFTVRKIDDDAALEVRILLKDSSLRFVTSIKRLQSRTTIIFMLWLMGASILFLLIAVLFMRNQIRPISRLAEAAENFGRGNDTPNFRPHGATEVRRAARAFIIMKERISRQMRTRTEMLAGISHDLRTPLTRMKLQLAMMKEGEEVRELTDDIQQMEHMIAEYLDFARGEGGEETSKTNLALLINDVVSDYKRLGSDVSFTTDITLELEIRVSAFRRMLHNLIDNALRYGKYCSLSLKTTGSYCEIVIDDKGPGIPEDKRDEVFRPFSRLETSRNIKTGGVGLGLTIARDIVLTHGGTITLADSPKGGLRVVIRLPI